MGWRTTAMLGIIIRDSGLSPWKQHEETEKQEPLNAGCRRGCLLPYSLICPGVKQVIDEAQGGRCSFRIRIRARRQAAGPLQSCLSGAFPPCLLPPADP